jgi:putative SOS response-associated peptidase YedK
MSQARDSAAHGGGARRREDSSEVWVLHPELLHGHVDVRMHHRQRYVLSGIETIDRLADDRVAPIHNRMPAILRPEDYAIWLGERPADAEALSAACNPIPAEDMRACPINTRVNSPRNDDPTILEEALT